MDRVSGCTVPLYAAQSQPEVVFCQFVNSCEKAVVVRAQVYLRSSLPCSFILLCVMVYRHIFVL